VAGKRLNFDDNRSKLFFEFVRLKNEFNPTYFLLENVIMEDKIRDAISELLGVQPVCINSSLVSAQNRVRYYWTNLPIPRITDLGIKLRDIIDNNDSRDGAAIRGRNLNKATIQGRKLDSEGKRKDKDKNLPLTQCLEVRATNTDKSNCLTSFNKNNVLTYLPIGRYPDAYKNKLPFRFLSKTELCRLQTLPESYFDLAGSTQNQIVKMTGNCWTVKVVEQFFKSLK
jgi:DNA (cytosine-5)-methyltransferase 3A